MIEAIGLFLDKTFPATPVVDLLRVSVIVLTVLVLVLAYHVNHRGRMPYDSAMLGMCVCYWIFAVLQELQQIGKPFVWWRLPLLLLGALLGLRSVLRRL